jgi:hypothetical protein
MDCLIDGMNISAKEHFLMPPPALHSSVTINQPPNYSCLLKEYVPGRSKQAFQSLGKVIFCHGILAPVSVCYMFSSVCGGVSEAKSRGMMEHVPPRCTVSCEAS